MPRSIRVCIYAKIRIEFSVAGGYLWLMRRAFMWMALAGLLAVAGSASAATGRVIKVLPQFLDLKGRNSLSPSLYERDLYQSRLQQDTNLCSGMRFNVQWKAKGDASAAVKLFVELRGVAHGDFPRQLTLEKQVQPGGWFSHWTALDVVGAQYKDLGVVTAWRVTLREGTRVIGEQKSFLW